MPVSSNNKLELGRVRQAWDRRTQHPPGRGFYRWLLGGAIERVESDTDVVLSQRLRAGPLAGHAHASSAVLLPRSNAAMRSTDAAEASTDRRLGQLPRCWRRLDSVLLPTEGCHAGPAGRRRPLARQRRSSGLFARAYGRLTGYRPLGQDLVRQARVELGQVAHCPAVWQVPDAARLPCRRRRLGARLCLPQPGAGDATAASAQRQRLLTASLELARPIVPSMPSLWGAVFVDAGRAAEFGTTHPGLGLWRRHPLAQPGGPAARGPGLGP
jgi:translocation and assembly module TamA